MNDKFLNVLLVVLIVLICAFQCPCKKSVQRYEVIPAGNMLTLLVDNQTGMTWRNSICNDKSPVPGCWTRMYTIDNAEFNLPQGEQNARKKEIKLMEKIQKEQLKQQKKQSAQPQTIEIDGDLEVGDDGAQVVPQQTPKRK